MKLPVHFLQPRLVHVRVDLRGLNAGVSEHFLDLPQVGAAGRVVSVLEGGYDLNGLARATTSHCRALVSQ